MGSSKLVNYTKRKIGVKEMKIKRIILLMIILLVSVKCDVNAASALKGKEITVKWGTTALIKEDGSLWMWGANGGGQLADGTVKRKNSPIQVKQLKNHVITPTSKNIVYNGAALKLNAKASGGGTLSYKSNNTKIVTVSSTGKVTPKKYGKTTITVTAKEKGDFVQTKEKITIKVVPKKLYGIM